MRDVIDAVLADAWGTAIPSPSPRRARLWSIDGKIDAVIGPRRTGKTWLLFDRMQQLARDGVARERMLYLNFEDERLLPLGAADLQLIPEGFWRRFPASATAECWFFFDEIQTVPGWDRFVRRLLDRGGIRLAVTGSSAKLLSREIATSLRGRSLSTEVLPFGFDEFLAHRRIEAPKTFPPKDTVRARLSSEFRAYLEIGGFPEVQSLDRAARTHMLQEYVDVAMLRDVIERHGVSQVGALRWLVRRLITGPGSLFSVHKAYADLKSQGVAVSKDTLHKLVHHIEDAFIAFLVPTYTESPQARATNPRKVYVSDHGLARAFSVRTQPGHLLENIVYTELRRRGFEVAYYQTKDRFEVDFVATRDGATVLVQVCSDVSDPATRAREVQSTTAGMRELGVREATVVTLDDVGGTKVPGGEITFVPAWRWLLADADELLRPGSALR